MIVWKEAATYPAMRWFLLSFLYLLHLLWTAAVCVVCLSREERTEWASEYGRLSSNLWPRVLLMSWRRMDFPSAIENFGAFRPYLSDFRHRASCGCCLCQSTCAELGAAGRRRVYPWTRVSDLGQTTWQVLIQVRTFVFLQFSSLAYLSYVVKSQ